MPFIFLKPPKKTLQNFQDQSFVLRRSMIWLAGLIPLLKLVILLRILMQLCKLLESESNVQHIRPKVLNWSRTNNRTNKRKEFTRMVHTVISRC